MNSPFADYDRRVFLCFGQTRDRFVLPEGLPCGFDDLLAEHLRGLGYEFLVFYGHKGLAFRDEPSRNWAMRDAPVAPVAAPAPSGPRLTPGPEGLSLRTPRAAAPVVATPPTVERRLLYPELARLSEVVMMLRRCLREVRRVAIIFHDTHRRDFAAPSETAEQFRGILEAELPSLPPDHRLIVIFIFGQQGAQLAEHIHSDRPVLNLLIGRDAQVENTGIAALLPISSPYADEVAGLIHYYRLRRGLRVEWSGFERRVTALTGYLRGKGERLSRFEKALLEWSEQGLPLDDAQVRAFTGRTLHRGDARERLARMEGMTKLRRELEGGVERFRYWRESRARQARSAAPRSLAVSVSRLAPEPRETRDDYLHIALMGPPGTGKTTAAELIGELYRDAGILETGHTVIVKKEDLCGGFVGQTALKTREKIEQARGGVLFVDEAYSLVQQGPQDFGAEAVTTLVAAMHDYRGELVVVFAGYPNEIHQLIDSNPGLDSRLAKVLVEDFSPVSLEAVFRRSCAEEEPPVALDPELEARLPAFFRELHERRDARFANARTVRESVLKPAIREAVLESTASGAGQLVLRVAHFPAPYRDYFTAGDEAGLAPLEELDRLIGLRGVKHRIHALVAEIENERARRPGVDARVRAGHYLFVGNPGTGKTTVARLMARQFKRMGLLPKDTLIERSATDLIGRHVGDTENNVREVLEQALGGVLFIDEAHQLAEDEHGYGANALRPFVPFMTRHEADFSLIFAGYPEGIARLLASDQGLRRRFEQVDFEDFMAADLVEVVRLAAGREGFELVPEADRAVTTLCDWLVAHKGREFGNAGYAERVFRMARERLALRMRERVAAGEEISVAERNTLIAEDIPCSEDCHYLLQESLV